MEAIVQWATILSPIIAVVIAIWASRSSAKETAKEIAVMQENTEKEIQRLKELAELQAEALALKVEMELIYNSLAAQQADEERNELKRVMDINQLTFREMALREFESKKSERNHKYMMTYLQELKKISVRLSQIKQHIN